MERGETSRSPKKEESNSIQATASSSTSTLTDPMAISPKKNLKRTLSGNNGDKDPDELADADEPTSKRARRDEPEVEVESPPIKPSLLRSNSTSNPDRSKSVPLREWKSDEGQFIQVRLGDLTLEDTDSIVNAANSHLSHGAGVAGAVVRRGGDIIQRESDRIMKERGESLNTGDAVITKGGRLYSPWVIHAVGPIYEDGTAGEDQQLRTAVSQSLLLAAEKGFYSISLPAISSGIFGFPKDKCARIMFDTVLDFFGDNPDSSLKLVRFTNFDQPTARIFVNEFDDRFKPVDPRNFDDILDDAEIDIDELRSQLHESSDEEPLEVTVPTRFGENGEEDSSSAADSLDGGFYVHKAAYDGDYPDEDLDEDGDAMSHEPAQSDDDDAFL